MSSHNHHIHNYQFEFHTQYQNGAVRDTGIMYLYGGHHQLLAAIAFVPDNQVLDEPSETPGGHVSMQMHLARMAPLVDMLRNERPVIFCWSAAAGVVRITSQEEPVGEQELKRLFSFLYV